jgi:hypothetical protein
MHAPDLFPPKLAAAIRQLAACASGLRPDALVDIEQVPGCWRLSITPKVSQACPLELLLLADQKFDLSVGGELYEDQPLTDLDLFPKLVVAVANGDVITRRWASPVTGLAHSVETIIGAEQVPLWRGEQINAFAADSLTREASLRRDRRYVPYHRGANREL